MAFTPAEEITAAGFPVYLHGFNAVDSYLGRKNTIAFHAICGADLADLARIFENLRYPGAALADAAVDSKEKTWYFKCLDSDSGMEAAVSKASATFDFLEFYQDCKTGRYYDTAGIYPYLRFIRDGVKCENIGLSQIRENSQIHPRKLLNDMAVILAKYFPETTSREIGKIAEKYRCQNCGKPSTEEQKILLAGLLEAANPAGGFELLYKSGYISAYWPELAVLNEVDHCKEYHPEGNVWKHTMEALGHRKAAGSGFELKLSLGLLLHDLGKPLSKSAGSRRFDGHAEMGSRQARRFLERLNFESGLIDDVCYLVRNHMLPAALPRLPLNRTGDIMVSPLFPLLLELYRCDEASSFKDLGAYYQSSAAYKNFLKNRRNPYRLLTAAQL